VHARFRRGDEARAELHRVRAEREERRDAGAVGDAAACPTSGPTPLSVLPCLLYGLTEPVGWCTETRDPLWPMQLYDSAEPQQV
jgi:hypothetical protein